MKYLLSLALLLTSLSIQAEIYRWTDEEGNVHFSDKEHPDAELIPTPTPNTVPMPKLEPKKPVAEKKKDSPYKTFSIISPENNATIRDNAGNISINLSIQPELNIKKGHKIAIFLDGQAAISSTTKLKAQLSNTSRGKHTLSARVIDRSGKQIISSNPITIHIKRLSTQHGKPSDTPAGPLDSEGKPYTPGPKNPDGKPYTPGPQNTIFVPGPITSPKAP